MQKCMSSCMLSSRRLHLGVEDVEPGSVSEQALADINGRGLSGVSCVLHGIHGWVCCCCCCCRGHDRLRGRNQVKQLMDCEQ